MKKEKRPAQTGKGAETRRLPFALRGGFFLYLLLLLATTVFTQVFRSPLSSVALLFLLLLPVADLLLFLLSARMVSSSLSERPERVEKGKTLYLTARVVNRGPFPLPFAEGYLAVPDGEGVRIEKERKRFPLPPFSHCDFLLPVKFLYHGFYTVGMGELLLSDLFRFFSLRKRIPCAVKITVPPRRLPPLPALLSLTEEGEKPRPLTEVGASNGYGDIRAYRPGDGIKSIHWKLSTKTEELQVKNPVNEKKNTLTILCGFGGRFSYAFPPFVRSASDDRVADEAFTAAAIAAEKGTAGRLVWAACEGQDRERAAQSLPGQCRTAEFSDPLSAEGLATLLCGISSSETPPSFAALPASLTEEASLLLVLPYASPETEGQIRAALSSCRPEAFTLCLIDLSYLLDGEEKEKYRRDFAALRTRLAAAGIVHTVPPLGEGRESV